MPAPTALLRAPDHLADEISEYGPPQGDFRPIATPIVVLSPVAGTAELIVDPTILPEPADVPLPSSPRENDSLMEIDAESRPKFAPATEQKVRHRIENRKVPVPPHRMTPLKAAWPKMYPPLVEHLKIQVRMNVKAKAVELRTSKHTTDSGALQKGEDFLRAFMLGFQVEDAIALLRLDDLYIETFEIKDVKNLNGEHLSRAIGRIAGHGGKTRYAIENASRTRVVLADSKIHILGGFKNIHIAREAIVSLILGSPPGKVYGNLRTVASRMKERF
jgi:RNA-binding protein PNO1